MVSGSVTRVDILAGNTLRGRAQERSVMRAMRAAAMSMVAIGVLCASPANALPSFAMQTDQPCSACHVGAYGPRLTQFGRDFKLYGYVANDTKEHTLPISVMGEFSFTHIDKDQVAKALNNSNDNAAVDAISLFYAGKLFNKVGAFIEVAYDAVEKSLHWEDFDIRYAKEFKVFNSDAVIGATVNNSPSIGDLWDTKPAWSFPFVESSYQTSPSAEFIVDKLPSTVFGAGGYAMFDDTIYVELDLYGGLSHGVLRALGTEPLNGADSLDGPTVYWRANWQREWEEGRHYVSLGTLGSHTDVYPGGVQGFGSDAYTDVGFDATYQWTAKPELSTSDRLSVHLLFLQEAADLNASHLLAGTRPTASLTTTRAEVAYSFGATYTPTVQYFQTHGSTDLAFWQTPNGDPGSNGWIFEMDYVPWGKPDAPLSWLNGRFALQYTSYDKFDGARAGASDNNTLILSLNLALAANR